MPSRVGSVFTYYSNSKLEYSVESTEYSEKSSDVKQSVKFSKLLKLSNLLKAQSSKMKV